MIKYKELRWDNCFSYGANNSIRFDQNPITQLVGKNGHGKSSIALILEEVLFNTNSKGIKKGNILNRHVKDKSYYISLDFEKDGDEYTIDVSRGSTQKVHLHKNGEDISSHTATATYADIEALIGYDHKTFSQIVYQSSTTSLEFLTATDTKRKKFLIDLLNLTKYGKALEVIKEESSKVSKDLAVQEASMKQAKDWIDKYSKETLEEQELLVEPLEPTSSEEALQRLRAQALNIQSENKAIAQNNKYKELRDSVVLLPAPTQQISDAQINDLRTAEATLSAELKSLNAELTKLSSVKTHCPTCKQALSGVDTSHVETHKVEVLEKISALKNQIPEATKAIETALKIQKELRLYQERNAEYERYNGMWDSTKPFELLDSEIIQVEIEDLERVIRTVKQDIATTKAKNEKIRAHNVKVALIRSQLEEMQDTYDVARSKFLTLAERATNLGVLVKAFSTTGLVAYKIECLVKDLEAITNEYLADMADGRFQISFQISAADKLNVIITDNGEDIDIAALSSGERARVNIATLLAIRKLMQSLSNTRTNLLVLDETVENLDAEGKERLIEVLLKEEGLNTFLISHGFTHPLLEKMHVIKENNISRIEQ